MQIPNLPNPYMQVAQPQQQPQSYNAVKIDVHNPSVIAPGVAAMPQAQYAQPTMPYYNYPQSSVYQYPQAPIQPYYMPAQQPTIIPPQVTEQTPSAPVAPTAPATAPAVATEVPQTPQPEVPQPVVTQKPAEQQPKAQQTPQIETPAPLEPQVDLNGFIAKLTNPDYEVQAAGMEEIANMVKDNPQKATELLDVKVMDTLNKIINTDSSKLAGPTPEQIAARQKLMKNEKMTDAEKALATSITPMEQAERNKSYAMFTTAILQKLYSEEVAKLTNTTVPLTELPGAVSIVEQLKNNPNPMVRTSAIEALSYIQQPAYKADLNTLFTIAKNDQDKNVQDAANAALAKLNQMQDSNTQAKTIEMTPAAQPAQNPQQAKSVEMNPAAQAPAQAA